MIDKYVYYMQVASDLTKRYIPFLILFAFAVILICYIHERKHNNSKKLVRYSLKEPEGIIFGKKKNGLGYVYSKFQDEGHCIFLGGSGCGKTSACLLPVIRSIKNTSTKILAMDIAGDITSNVPNLPHKLVFDPYDSNTVVYDVFGVIKILADQREQQNELMNLAFLIMPNPTNDSDGANHFFVSEGRKILISSLLAYYKEKSFIEICEKIIGSSWKDLFYDIDSRHNQLAGSFLNSFQGCSERNTAGCKQALDQALTLFATNDFVKQALTLTEGKKVFMARSIEEKNILLHIPDSKLELLAPVIRIINAQILAYLADRPSEYVHPIIICLDEFTSLKIDITDSLRKLRKRHTRICVFTQGINDLNIVSKSRAEAETMIANFKFKVILQAGSPDDQHFISRMIGHSEEDPARMAVQDEELDRLGEDLILLYPGDWMRLRKNYYYK